MYNYNDLLDYEYSLLTNNITRLLSYDEVKNFIDFCYSNGYYSSLLLGNGFSRAYSDKNFDLSRLTKKMASNNPIVNNIFQYLKRSNWDIEETMRILNQSIGILQCCSQLNPSGFDSVINELQRFSQNLKNQFIATIQTNHIENIDNGAKESALDFIKIYHCIFTLNYDLLLYWIISHNGLYPFADGFGRGSNDLLIFNHNFCGKHPFYFLHGALHLFYNKGDIEKLEYMHSTILDVINSKINDNHYPLCVTAGTADEKLETIKNNYYLSHCFDALSFLQDYNLIIFGTRLKSSDDHIQKAILQSCVKNIFFGVSNDSWMQVKQDLQIFIHKASAMGKNVFFYDYKSVDVWGNKNNV